MAAGWSYAATNPGTPGAPDTERVKENSPLEPSSLGRALPNLNFELLASGIVKQ